VSLFEHLANDDVIPLHVQYRMNDRVMALANRLVYGGRLTCGSDDVASRYKDLKASGPIMTLCI